MNRLQYEKSPYLLQHAKNPVNWYPWGKPAFAAARQEDKPVFLSIGYSTCHWCHVMARESFEDQEAAEAINQSFIPVKVDREERPDVDGVYMAACTAMTGSGGWPLTVLLTPEQKPFWAGTYLPKPQLMRLLEQASLLWKEHRADVESAGAQLTEHLRSAEEAAPGTPRQSLVHDGAAAFSRIFDAKWGGFGPAPKFPSAHNLLFLLRYAQVTGDARTREMAEATLAHMYRGGIYDHVGGGFSRYATDRRWLVPHFEKMLYDNALLALAYTEAYQMSGRAYCRQVARRTLDYCLKELRDPAGGFYCGQDADSEGVEGGFYVFSRKELTKLPGPDAGDFLHRFGVTEEGNFHGRNILNLLEDENWESAAGDFRGPLQALYEYRVKRAPLRRDDKVLTAWNALMIAALARAGTILDEPLYTEAAEQAADFIHARLEDGHGGLFSRWRDGEAAHPGKLDDYAFYAWGLLELYGATFQVRHLETAARMSERLLSQFFDAEHGGFYPYAADGEQLITRTKELYDGAMPSGNAVASLVLSRLARLTGEQPWRDAADTQFRYLAGGAAQYPAGHSFGLLALLEALWPTEELIVAAREIPGELRRFLRETPRPALTVLLKTPESAPALGKIAPLTAEYPIPETGAKYYLCRDGRCKAPADSLRDLDTAGRGGRIRFAGDIK